MIDPHQFRSVRIDRLRRGRVADGDGGLLGLGVSGGRVERGEGGGSSGLLEQGAAGRHRA